MSKKKTHVREVERLIVQERLVKAWSYYCDNIQEISYDQFIVKFLDVSVRKSNPDVTTR